MPVYDALPTDVPVGMLTKVAGTVHRKSVFFVGKASGWERGYLSRK
jgi:hypothetical protein